MITTKIPTKSLVNHVGRKAEVGTTMIGTANIPEVAMLKATSPILTTSAIPIVVPAGKEAAAGEEVAVADLAVAIDLAVTAGKEEEEADGTMILVVAAVEEILAEEEAAEEEDAVEGEATAADAVVAIHEKPERPSRTERSRPISR